MSSIPCHAAMKEAVQVRLPLVVRGTHLFPGLASFKTQTVIFSRGGRETKWRRREEMSVAEVRTACILIKISEDVSDLYFSKRVKSFWRTYQILF